MNRVATSFQIKQRVAGLSQRTASACSIALINFARSHCMTIHTHTTLPPCPLTIWYYLLTEDKHFWHYHPWRRNSRKMIGHDSSRGCQNCLAGHSGTTLQLQQVIHLPLLVHGPCWHFPEVGKSELFVLCGPQRTTPIMCQSTNADASIRYTEVLIHHTVDPPQCDNPLCGCVNPLL